MTQSEFNKSVQREIKMKRHDSVNDSDFETLSKWVSENPEADTSEFARSNGLRFGDKTYENSSEERKERYKF